MSHSRSRKEISPAPSKRNLERSTANLLPQTGMSMQDYDKIKIIGKGGFADKVYLVRKKDTGTLYAIKTMSKKFILEE